MLVYVVICFCLLRSRLSSSSSSSSPAFPAIALWFTSFGEIFAYVTVFNPTIEVVTFRLRGFAGVQNQPQFPTTPSPDRARHPPYLSDHQTSYCVCCVFLPEQGVTSLIPTTRVFSLNTTCVPVACPANIRCVVQPGRLISTT